MFFYMLVPFTIFFTDNYIERHLDISFLFLSVFTTICLLRLLHLRISARAPQKFETLHNQIFLGSVILTALAWGTGAAYFLSQAGEPKVQLIMTICTAGFCSGGVVSFVPTRWLAILYNLLMLLPAVAGLLIKGENVSLGIAMILYSAYLVLITFRGSEEYWNALENEFLLEEKSRELEQASRIDVLTGLYNRRHFNELFQLAWGFCGRTKTPLTLMICDIDNFKKINDTFGHLAGDEYLKLISRCLEKVFKRETDAVARYGGEEFVILFPEKEMDAIMELAERLRNNVAHAIMNYNGATIKTTISLGMSCCIPQAGQSQDLLVSQADTALYAAKDAGRNRVHIYGEDNS